MISENHTALIKNTGCTKTACLADLTMDMAVDSRSDRVGFIVINIPWFHHPLHLGNGMSESKAKTYHHDYIAKNHEGNEHKHATHFY